MSWNRSLVRKHKMEINRKQKIELRKHLNGDALLTTIRNGFENITDHRKSNTTISLADALMSGFAVFSLKMHFYLPLTTDGHGVLIT